MILLLDVMLLVTILMAVVLVVIDVAGMRDIVLVAMDELDVT